MDHSILPRVRQAEADLLDAIAGDDRDIERFAHNWHLLSTDVQSSILSGLLNESTLWTINVVARRVSILMESFLRCHTKADELTSDFMSGLEQIFSDLSLEEPSPAAPESSPSYIEPSCSWLLRNLHDPYPSKKTKESIARVAGCAVKDIDSWFVEARRRIGWNALRRSRFSNKRQSIIEAASCFFGKSAHGPAITLDLELEFANIQSQAESLYLHKLSEQPSPSSWGSHTRDQREPGRQRKRRRTPLQSNNTTVPPSRLSHHNSFGRLLSANGSRLVDNNSSTDSDSRASSIAPSHSSCSSPPSYADGFNDDSSECAYPLSSYHCSATAAPPLKRKRRLSLSDGVDTPKRPRTGCTGPRPYIVSDPLPCSSSSMSSSPERPFDGTDLPSFLEIELFNPSELFGLKNDISSSRFFEPANQATVIFTTPDPQAQSRRKAATTTTDLSYNPPVVSVTDNLGFGDHVLPLNGLPYLDIALDGLPDSALEFDWLAPFLDDNTLNGLLEPNSTFQLDLPSIDDVFSLDFPVSSTVY